MALSVGCITLVFWPFGLHNIVLVDKRHLFINSLDNIHLFLVHSRYKIWLNSRNSFEVILFPQFGAIYHRIDSKNSRERSVLSPQRTLASSALYTQTVARKDLLFILFADGLRYRACDFKITLDAPSVLCSR